MRLLAGALAALSVPACASSVDVPSSSSSDDLTEARPDLAFGEGDAVAARGFPASAPDGTVAVLDETPLEGGSTFVLTLKRGDEWGQVPLVVRTHDGRFERSERGLAEARAALGAKPFRGFRPAAGAAGRARIFEHTVELTGAELAVSSDGASAKRVSLANDLLELEAIYPGCGFVAALDEAYVSSVRNLVYARVDFRANGAPGCDDARTYVAVPLR